MNTAALSWLLLLLLFQYHWFSATEKALPRESGVHQGQRSQGLSKSTEFSEVRGGEGESEELDARTKVSHGREGGAGGEEGRSHGGANSDIYRHPRTGHYSAAPEMLLPYACHLSVILVPLFFY